MTYKVTAILFIVLATLLLVVACGPKEKVKEKPEVQETAADQEISGIESDISELDTLNEDLDLGDLESLEEDLMLIEELDLE